MTEFVCTDRGQHPARLVGVAEVELAENDARATRVVVRLVDGRGRAAGEVWSGPRSLSLVCSTCGREVRLSGRQVRAVAESDLGRVDVSGL